MGEKSIIEKKSKWLIPTIIVIGIIFLVLSSWAGYNHWIKLKSSQKSSDNEISTFKTYQSNLGYEIKYPPTWDYLMCMDGIQFFLYSPEDKMESCDEPHGYNSEISIIGPSDPPGNIDLAKSQKDIEINGIKAIRYIDVPYGQDVSSGLYQDMVVITKNEKTFTIDLRITAENSSLLDKILSTFKFIN